MADKLKPGMISIDYHTRPVIKCSIVVRADEFNSLTDLDELLDNVIETSSLPIGMTYEAWHKYEALLDD